MKSFPLILLFFVVFMAHEVTSKRDCYDEYRCLSQEVCWNGECVIRDPFAKTRRNRYQYGYDVAKEMTTRCDYSRDCRGLGVGYVCSKGTCRLIRR